MNITGTYELDGVQITFRTSMLEEALYRTWLVKFKDVATDDPTMSHFDLWLYMAACTVSVEGINWTRPARNADEETMVASYVSFMGQINRRFFDGLFEAMYEHNAPLSSDVDKTDDKLTDAEKKTTT